MSMERTINAETKVYYEYRYRQADERHHVSII